MLTDITLDSRQVVPGGAFLACRGARHHGLDFAVDVARRGAAAIVWEPDGVHQPPVMHSAIVLAQVPGLSLRTSLLADRFFGSPSRQVDVVGVTGTNGKTTCAWLLAQALTACGESAAYMGTLGSAFGAEQVAGEMTTPDAITVQRKLAQFHGRGARKVAMEVSSHGLAQARVAAVHFDAAVFTNLTRDHLDFHGDMTAYGAAKASLFERDDVRLRVFNVDDAFGASLAARPGFVGRIACTRAVAMPATGPFLSAQDMRFTAAGTRFALRSSFGDAVIQTALVGAFNVDNLLAVLAVLLGSGVSLPPDRPMVVVDYAHTPDALEQVLRVLRPHCSGRLGVVFGCGGDRDRGKRPLMGAVAARLADDVLLTSDNPRSEDPANIIADIKAGVGATTVTVIQDRRAAIAHALQRAVPGDVVLVAGKGHEATQIAGGTVLPFSDQAVVREWLGSAA
jgi:UDP-N-acetylmuramoyl-L-alanyl-D-glutamate--2,6-diaminopimelate ligase